VKRKELLRDFTRRHRWRMSKSLAVSAVTTGIGFTLFWTLTSLLHAEGTRAVMVNAGLAIPMMVFGFVVSWLLVWNDRNIEPRRGFRRWTTKTIMLGGFSQLSFFVLVGLLGLEHMMIAAALIVAKAPFGYALNHWVFQDDDSKMA
jgi:putative flippase GtrA